ncbi:MAG: methyltransferase [Crenarchaeota archaeon]|nr:methyltransferase [Thermoproteota archaeon]
MRLGPLARVMLTRMLPILIHEILTARKAYIVEIGRIKIIVFRGCFRPDISYSTYLTMLGLLRILKKLNNIRKICEIGTGSGAISITVAKIFKRYVVVTDISAISILNVRKNIKLTGSDENIDIVRTYAGSCLRDLSFDLAVTNPPYLPCDRYVEICSGLDMKILREILKDCYRIVRRGGKVLYTTSSIAPIVLGRVIDEVRTPIDTVYLVVIERC